MNQPDKILILRLSSIGDIILSYPLIRNLRKKFPQARIDFMVAKKFRTVLTPIQNRLNNIIVFDKSRGIQEIKARRQAIKNTGYDWILDIHSKPRTWLLLAFLQAQVFRIKKYQIRRWLFVKFGFKAYPAIPVHKKYLNTAPIKFKNLDPVYLKDCNSTKISQKVSKSAPFIKENHPVVIIFPGAKHATKRWLINNYMELAQRIVETTDLRVLLAGDQQDKKILEASQIDHPNISNICGKFSLLEIICLISQCDLVISNDSGPMHIGALFRKPQIAIFGNTVTDFGFAPQNDRAIIVENSNLSCRPCSHIGYEECPKNHFKCMKEITVPRVYDEFFKLIQNFKFNSGSSKH
ncbi:MAG TPA: glycosyltransferase family 9 protein [bacterium]|nr:glycosyltransferase family 9 protein [bacterium]